MSVDVSCERDPDYFGTAFIARHSFIKVKTRIFVSFQLKNDNENISTQRKWRWEGILNSSQVFT